MWGSGIYAPHLPQVVEPVKTQDERLIDALYTHSPAGFHVLRCLLGFDPTDAIERSMRFGRVVARQIGDVQVYALKGSLGS